VTHNAVRRSVKLITSLDSKRYRPSGILIHRQKSYASRSRWYTIRREAQSLEPLYKGKSSLYSEKNYDAVIKYICFWLVIWPSKAMRDDHSTGNEFRRNWFRVSPSPGLKPPEHGANHSLSSNAEGKNGGPTPPLYHTSYGVVFNYVIRYRDNSTLLLLLCFEYNADS
jgi:hypothetical protein